MLRLVAPLPLAPALAGLLWLATPAVADVPSSYPGANLVPIRAMAYQPAPSDYAPCQGCVYYDTDFFNSDFQKLWDDADGGRGDLPIMARQLGVNFLHLYNWNPARDHLPALNKARSLGIKVAVPISSYFVFDDPNAAVDIEKIMRQVYVNEQGQPSTTPHPAVGMILVANEPEYVSPGGWQAPVVTAIKRMRQAEQAIGATSLLPVSVPFSFGIDTTDPNADNPRGIAGAGQNNSLIAALNSDATLGIAFVKSRFVAATNPQNPGSFMTGWISDFKQTVPDTPVWFSEQGTGVAESCAGYQNCTPSEQQQAIFNADQFAATKPGAGDVVLGGAQFEWTNEPWKPGPNEPTFGIYKFTGAFQTVPTSGGTYRVDALEKKPSWEALRNAFGGAGEPAAGGGGQQGASTTPTGSSTPMANPSLGPVGTGFTVGRGAALNRAGTAVRLTFNATGPGGFLVRDASATTARARTAAAKRRPLVRPTRARATAAGPVTVTVPLTRAGRTALADRRRLRLRLSVTFTPDGGTPATKTVSRTLKGKSRRR
jgi:hypothetical protein